MSKSTIRKVAVVGVLAFALVVGATAYAAKPGGGGGGTGGCPKDFFCADIYDPVQCADGVVYGNQCYADRECAPKPCQSVGGPVEL